MAPKRVETKEAENLNARKLDGLEVTVLPWFISMAAEIQCQLCEELQIDRYLRDRLQKAMKISAIQDPLMYIPPQSDHRVIYCVGNRLSSIARTAGTVCEN